MNKVKEQGSLKRVLGARELLTISIGSMIGWGWIIYPAYWIGDSGSIGSIIGFILAGIWVSLIGLTYGELTSIMPKAGGEQVFSWRGLGPWWSLACGWSLLIVYGVYAAYYPISIVTGLQYIFTVPNGPLLWMSGGTGVYLIPVLMGVTLSAIMVFINFKGIQQSAILQTATVFVLLGVGITFVVTALIKGDAANLVPTFNNGFNGITKTLLIAPLMLAGFDVIPQASEELDIEPKKIGGYILVTIAFGVFWYGFILLACSMSMPVDEFVKSPLAVADAFKTVAGGNKLFGNILVVAGICGIISSWNALLIASSRLFFAMGRVGQIPGWFAYINPKTDVPTNSLLFVGAMCFISPFAGRMAIGWLTEAAGFALFVVYPMVALSYVMIRLKEPDIERPFRAPGGIALGILAVGAGLAILFLFMPWGAVPLPRQSWFILLGWSLIGLMFGIISKAQNKEEIINNNFRRILNDGETAQDNNVSS